MVQGEVGTQARKLETIPAREWRCISLAMDRINDTRAYGARA